MTRLMVMILVLVSAVFLDERSALGQQTIWFQINVYNTTPYYSTSTIAVDGVSYGDSGTCYFGAKSGKTGLVVTTEGSAVLKSTNLHMASRLYEWRAPVKPVSKWALSPLQLTSPNPMPGLFAPDHYFTVQRNNVQYGTKGGYVVIK